jgi:hypothetical protein
MLPYLTLMLKKDSVTLGSHCSRTFQSRCLVSKKARPHWNWSYEISHTRGRSIRFWEEVDVGVHSSIDRFRTLNKGHGNALNSSVPAAPTLSTTTKTATTHCCCCCNYGALFFFLLLFFFLVAFLPHSFFLLFFFSCYLPLLETVAARNSSSKNL